MDDQARKQCFFITPIGLKDSAERQRSDDLLHVLRPLLDQLGYDMTRADEDPDPGQIMPQVLDSIANADVVIADVSGRNPNVYYELAVAHAARRPTVIIQEKDENLPFDIADMRAISYDLSRPPTTSAMAEAVRRAVVAAQSGRQLRNPLDELTFGAVEADEAAAVRAAPEATALADLSEEVRAIGSEVKRLSNAMAKAQTANVIAHADAAMARADVTLDMRREEALIQDWEEVILETYTNAGRSHAVDAMPERRLREIARTTRKDFVRDLVFARLRELGGGPPTIPDPKA